MSTPVTRQTDSLSLRCLVQALGEFLEAEAVERREREAFVGYSWDHFGQSLIKQREEAAAEFGKRLDEYIDTRIQAATGAAP